MSETFTIDTMLRLPRLSSLALSPDGRRLVVAVGGVAPDGKKMATSLWQLDPRDETQPRRLTRSVEGEGTGIAFLPDGALLFESARPDPDAKPDPEKKVNALWALPADGGEARMLVAPEGGVCGIAVARAAHALVFGANVHRGTTDFAGDAERQKARKEAGVEALLFEDYPIRHWDHYLGPRLRRLYAATVPDDEERIDAPRDLDGDVTGYTFDESDADIAPDGSFVVGVKRVFHGFPETLDDLVRYDVATGEDTAITHGDAAYDGPRIAPDGRSVAALRITYATPDEAQRVSLVLIDLATGEQRTLAAEVDRWPDHVTWGPDASVLYFTADDLGGHAVWRVDLPEGATTRLTAEGTVTDVCPTPDGEAVYALQSSVAHPPRVVRFDARTPDQVPHPLANGIDTGSIVPPGVVERVTANGDDGTPLAGWLVRPPTASDAAPAPLVVFVHGGPLSSWNGWHWRWNPHILVERGYAVLLPDPAFSTGYGQHMIDRGWGQWGGNPYTDVMAVFEAVAARSDIDGDTVALMGGSYGGYMANWVAGKTDRFRCIVTHASLWELLGFHGTTDHGPAWEHEMGDPYTSPAGYTDWSPRELLASMAEKKTPLLVIHGEKDHRVPISEALILWTDMARMGVPGRFLYFPDENHWVLKPQNARLWYGTVLGFLDEHLRAIPFKRDPLLGG
ncbi:MAG TPA: S9 family peptidase [Candidatus Limnocylindrales bacterium]|nr:S9 family peptidase [Candidatus Limnocylindrales bacterium]